MKNQKFRDIESGEIVTTNDLREIYDNDETLRSEYESFSVYLRCCMTREGGTLELVKEEENRK